MPRVEGADHLIEDRTRKGNSSAAPTQTHSAVQPASGEALSLSKAHGAACHLLLKQQLKFTLKEEDKMSAIQHFTTEQAREFGDKFGVDWDWSFSNVEQFPMKLDIELEHGRHDPSADVTGNDAIFTRKIARAYSMSLPITTHVYCNTPLTKQMRLYNAISRSGD